MSLQSFALADLKAVYRALHKHLMEHPELMDSEFLDKLQSHLQTHAQEEGIDLGLHAQWEAWLRGASPEQIAALEAPEAPSSSRLRLVPSQD